MRAKGKNLDPKTAEGTEQIITIAREYMRERGRIHALIEQHLTRALCDKALALDIEEPSSDESDMWRVLDTPPGDDIALTPKGRNHLRKMIDAEKSRRFEIKTLWVTKFWLPLLAALVGIIGALTGLFAVLQHKR